MKWLGGIWGRVLQFWRDATPTARVLLAFVAALVVIWGGIAVYVVLPSGTSGGSDTAEQTPPWQRTSIEAFKRGLEVGGRRGCEENFAETLLRKGRIGIASDADDPYRLSYPYSADATIVTVDRCWQQTEWSNTFAEAGIEETYGSDPGATAAFRMGTELGWNHSCGAFSNFEGATDLEGASESTCEADNPYD